MSAVDLLRAHEPFALPSRVYEKLERAYRVPPRAYHSLEHIVAFAAHFAEVARDVGWDDPKSVWCAMLFHDAVYDVKRHDNEAESARMAERVLSPIAAAHELDLDRVAHLITLTARHGHLRPVDLDRDAALFVDCDMAILGAEPSGFASYESAICTEYAAVIDAESFAYGRAAFLQTLLKSDRIYVSAYWHDRLEEKARANIRHAFGV
ncbi:MAG: HD domain-containing protein [Sandaracinaceae bacterium]|nr:HD domain-containing protein [Sandaracinaceae bacterium]